MKLIYTLCFSAIIFSAHTTTAQTVGFNTDAFVGTGQNQLATGVPVHGGVAWGFFFSPAKTPFSFGYRNNINWVSSYTVKEVPFYREDYVHTVANISNFHNISQHILFVRLELNKNGFISPFAEGGLGYA
ncbi:MAG TPA: hypothetical protein VD905_12470, partial [Flavobacteriales bacterium]|nr:hypothetical protein [Flavobacteriales bacterium]